MGDKNLDAKAVNEEDLGQVVGGAKQYYEGRPEDFHYCHDDRCSMYNAYQDTAPEGRCRACGQLMHPFKNM